MSPIQTYLDRLHAELATETSGKVATYIPQLGAADPNAFGIAIATADGKVYSVGDVATPFTIQSASKPFVYAYALGTHSRAEVLAKVGVEPTGDAFNSIILDEVHNRPYNPMVNAGAIAISDMIAGPDRASRSGRIVDWLSAFAGRDLRIDEDVFRSEDETGHRNRAIAYMMLNSGMIDREPADVLDLYFRQCSVELTCTDLALMAATLANRGVQPDTGKSLLGERDVRDVLTVMSTCGMYNYAGQWTYDVGLPAKSGVSGAIIAVIPGQLGIAVYSPPLDAVGNSVRGVMACKAISQEFGLHQFHSTVDVGTVVRREYSTRSVTSTRLRTPGERRVLEAEGRRIAVLEVQGALFFGSVERLLRRVTVLAANAETVIIDFKHVHLADAAAIALLRNMVEVLAKVDCQVTLTNLAGHRTGGALADHIEDLAKTGGLWVYETTDSALERSEDEILQRLYTARKPTELALAGMDLFEGLKADECRVLEDLLRPLQFKAGDVIVREGEAATDLFVVVSGSVGVHLPLAHDRLGRIATIGPGISFGEMALIDGARRSTRVIADGAVACYAFDLAALHELGDTYPNIMLTLLKNMTRELSDRLRLANDEIRALE